MRLRLSLLVAGTMLPMMMFAIGLIYLNHQQDREVAFDGVLQTVRSMRLVLDSEVNAITASLTVLALSQALQRGDIEGFRQNAQAFVDRYPNESALSLADRDGHQLLNTRVPAGEPLPSRQNRAGTEAVFRTGHPVYSHVFVGSVARVPIITIDVPVLHGAEVVYLLSFNPPLSMFQRIVEQQRPSEEWTASIFDQDGVHIARVPNPEQIVGKRASPSLYDQMMKTNEAKVNTTTIEGQHVLTAFTRSPLTGWIVVAGVSTSTITVPLWRTLAVTGAIGALLLAVGLFFAIGMATRIARAEALHGLLVNELNHRVKNTLVVVQSIAMQSLHNVAAPGEFLATFNARLLSLSRAHDLLTRDAWRGAWLGDLVGEILAPYCSEGGGRLALDRKRRRLDHRRAALGVAFDALRLQPALFRTREFLHQADLRHRHEVAGQRPRVVALGRNVLHAGLELGIGQFTGGNRHLARRVDHGPLRDELLRARNRDFQRFGQRQRRQGGGDRRRDERDAGGERQRTAAQQSV